MAYKLPKDDDGVRYHGVVDENDENPGQVLYGVDENGDYRPVNVDKDGNVLTKVTGSYTEESVSHQRIGIIPAGTSETLFDFPNRRVELQSLSMGSNSKFLQIRIFFYKKDGSVDGSLKVADRRGTNLHDPTASAVQLNSSGENDFWAVRNYDEQNNEYVLTMKRSLTAFSGMCIVIHNPESTEKNVAVNAFTSIWKGA